MNPSSWLRHSTQIARIERTRSQRQLGRSSIVHTIIIVLLVGITVGDGIGAYRLGRTLSHGQITLPLDKMRAATTAAFLMLLWLFAQQTSRGIERIDTDFYLTSVTANELALGVVFFVYSRVAVPVSLPVISVALGFAIGTRSIASAFTIIVAVAGFLALTALIGIGISFVVELVTSQFPRFRRYKNVFVVMAAVLVLMVWTATNAGVLSVDRLVEWFGIAPTAWFIDLSLLGASGVQTELFRSVGAVVVIIGGIPVLTVVTTGLATRVWETEPVRAATIHRSRSLVGAGVAERLFAGYVSRPVLTVARKRWLQQRRAPLGLMMMGYLIFLLPSIFLPAFAASGIPGLSLISLVFICASGIGLAFGMPLLGLEYSSLPMTLSTVPGEQFIRGIVLAGIAIGGPIIVLGIFVLGIWSPLGILELLLLAVGGVVLCVCSITFAAVLSLRSSYFEFQAVPLPFTNATVYGVVGRRGFINLGEVLVLIGLVCLPAFVSYGMMFFDSSVATLVGSPTAVARVGSLVLVIIVAVGISMVAYRRAVRLYNHYILP